MKRKKRAWLIPVLIILGILIVYLVVALTLPKGLGPIEPFLNLGDLFTKSDGTTPGKPAYYQKMYDCSTGELAPAGGLIQPATGCDDWQLNRYERPFNSVTQDEYYPDLDIQYALLGRDAGWYYLRIALFDPQPKAKYLSGTYAIEMDLDGDGRGDLLVLVAEPGKEAGKNWSTGGVQIWTDTNDDVGDGDPNAPDSGAVFDGYDKLLFDQGSGDDPNGAWARAFFSGSAFVELAFKADYLGEALSFRWQVWASNGKFPPAMFELHDTFSHEQAGDPYQAAEFFPIREIYALDGTCVKVWGADPDPLDPEVCVGDPEYQHCALLRLFRCRIPHDQPGDPCVLPFKEWFESIWKTAHPNEPVPSMGELWAAYNEYLLMPECPPEEPTRIPRFTLTPVITLTNRFTLTPVLTLTPTITLTPPRVCYEWLNEKECSAAGGQWDPGSQPVTGGPSVPPHCVCP